jgi:hypothetical protein
MEIKAKIKLVFRTFNFSKRLLRKEKSPQRREDAKNFLFRFFTISLLRYLFRASAVKEFFSNTSLFPPAGTNA